MSGANAVGEIADLALGYCREVDGRIRVEDAISTAAAIAGEACLSAGRDLDPDKHDFVPGQAIISDSVNLILGGGSARWDSFAPSCPFGLLQSALPLIGFSTSDVPDLEPIFTNFVSSIGNSAQKWGWVPLTVPEANRPRVMPLRVAFELRSKVGDLYKLRDIPIEERPLVCTGALARILGLTRNTLAPGVALLLAYETLVGMSKTVPINAKHLSGLAKPLNS